MFTRADLLTLLHGPHGILAEAVFIGERVAFVEHSTVDASAQVFREIAEHARMDYSNDTVRAHLDARRRPLSGQLPRHCGEKENRKPTDDRI